MKFVEENYFWNIKVYEKIWGNAKHSIIQAQGEEQVQTIQEILVEVKN